MTRIRILGSGTSTGVPSIGCNCEVCQSSNPKDKRLRTSALYEDHGVRILLDCGPDFRQQILPLPFQAIDAVFISHEHFDHVGGIDDLRAFSYESELPIYANKLTVEHLKQRMPYCFVDKSYPGIPRLSLHTVEAGVAVAVGPLSIMPISVLHGSLDILAYRIGKMAYITDMLSMPEESYALLQNLDVLIINALRHAPHRTHQTLEQALEVSERIGAQSTYFIHMSDAIGLHERVDSHLPKDCHLAYDGLEIEL